MKPVTPGNLHPPGFDFDMPPPDVPPFDGGRLPAPAKGPANGPAHFGPEHSGPEHSDPEHRVPGPTLPPPIATNPTMQPGIDNVMTDPIAGFGHAIGYSFDGTGNNVAHPTLGAAGGDELRMAPAHFAAGTVNTPVDGPNARVVSNTIMANDPELADIGGRSAYMYAFGQFVDHDLDRNPSQTPNATNQLSIAVPVGDPAFPAGSSITISRAQIDPATGTAINKVTSYADLSQVYGSDATTAASLRNADGTMKTSAGGNLPIVNGQFAGGDVRAAENPDLTSLDVLFVREHNYWVAKLHAAQPALTGDQVYDMARALTTAEYQNILYKEYLPALLGPNALSAYRGYNPNVSAQIFQEFSTAAFRFGHTIISPTESKIANDGTVLEQKNLIAAASEAPSDLALNGGVDALLRNMAADGSQREGVHIVNELLNLFSPVPGQIFDLGAVDIERTRDLGLGTLNETRVALGLKPYTGFAQITKDTALQAQLQQVYGSVDKIDLFVGGLAETAAKGAMVGQTFETIMVAQFQNLRDGDRLFYENQGFAPRMMAQIENTTLSDVILRTTDTTVIQANAFIAYDRHSSAAASGDPSKPQLVIGVNTDNAVISGVNGVDNILVSGAGLHQILIGTTGHDTFEFLGSGHRDLVQNFRPGQDILDFEGLTAPTTFKDVSIVKGPNGGTIVKVAGNTIDLAGVDPKALCAGNFRFNEMNPALLAAQMPGSH